MFISVRTLLEIHGQFVSISVRTLSEIHGLFVFISVRTLLEIHGQFVFISISALLKIRRHFISASLNNACKKTFQDLKNRKPFMWDIRICFVFCGLQLCNFYICVATFSNAVIW